METIWKDPSYSLGHHFDDVVSGGSEVSQERRYVGEVLFCGHRHLQQLQQLVLHVLTNRADLRPKESTV